MGFAGVPIENCASLGVHPSARELLAHYDLAAQIKPYQMKNVLSKIDADGV
jgi:hypothetical protein